MSLKRSINIGFWKEKCRIILKRPYYHSPLRLGRAVYSMGSGVFGALGQGDLDDSPIFSKVDLSTVQPCSISTGWGHSSVGTDKGLVVFGRPYDFLSLMRINRLYKSFFPILGKMASRMTLWFGDKTGGLYTVPKFISDLDVTSVSCSAGLTIFLTTNGDVYSFGLNRWGQCGLTRDDLHIYNPVKVDLPPIIRLDTGLQHCICLSNEGEVFTWGKGEKGQLGDGKLVNSFHPVKLSLPAPAKCVSAGFGHSAAILTDGSLYIWGKGLSQIPKKSYTGVVKCYEDQIIPRKIDLGGRKVVEVQSSNFNIVIRAEDGSLWAIGMGELDRDMHPNPIPVYVYDPDYAHRELVEIEGKISDPAMHQVYLGSEIQMCKGYRRVNLFKRDSVSQISTLVESTIKSVLECEPSDKVNIDSKVSVPLSSLSLFLTSQKDKYDHEEETFHSTYEVVLHQNEASIQPRQLPGLPKDAKLLDVSVGWMHSLALVEEKNSTD